MYVRRACPLGRFDRMDRVGRHLRRYVAPYLRRHEEATQRLGAWFWRYRFSAVPRLDDFYPSLIRRSFFEEFRHDTASPLCRPRPGGFADHDRLRDVRALRDHGY